jgi:hypothetical protein
LYFSHLPEVQPSIDNQQRRLYLENTFHERARARALQLYEAQIARDNVGLFKRLMAVHTRRPREFLTHTVDNPKTQSRYLEYARIREDNARLVQRLLQSRSFVNERGSWDDHALNHEEQLTRLSLNPRNCFIPNLHAKRRKDQLALRERSVTQQAQDRLKSKLTPVRSHVQNAVQQLEVQEEYSDDAEQSYSDMEAEEKQQSNQQQQQQIRSSNHTRSQTHRVHSRHHAADSQSPPRAPVYYYPLPPSSLPSDHADVSSARRHAHTARAPHPPVRLPAGTHLVAPALVDQSQYDELTARLDALQEKLQPHAYGAGHFAMPMPPPSHMVLSPPDESEDRVFYLRPYQHRPRSGPQTDGAVEAQPVEYPFPQPRLDEEESDSAQWSPEAAANTSALESPAEEAKEQLSPMPPARRSSKRATRKHRQSGSLHAGVSAAADALEEAERSEQQHSPDVSGEQDAASSSNAASALSDPGVAAPAEPEVEVSLDHPPQHSYTSRLAKERPPTKSRDADDSHWQTQSSFSVTPHPPLLSARPAPRPSATAHAPAPPCSSRRSQHARLEHLLDQLESEHGVDESFAPEAVSSSRQRHKQRMPPLRTH